MIEPPVPENELKRLSALVSLDILDTYSEKIYDDITHAVCAAFGMPISLISLVDSDRQWFKSKVGIDSQETSRSISFCAHVTASNKPLIVEDALEDDRFQDNPLVTSSPNIRSYLGMPLTVADDITLGTLCVIGTEPRIFKEHEIQLLAHLRDVVVKIIKFRDDSLTDPMTGLFNRRMFAIMSDKIISANTREHTTFSLILFDVDRFKNINDSYGHDAGDSTLIHLSKKLHEVMRREDLIFRLGGDEFAIVSPHCELQHAYMLAERLRAEVEQNQFVHKNKIINITISTGVSEYIEGIDNISSLLSIADEALLQAKENGRNQVVKVDDINDR